MAGSIEVYAFENADGSSSGDWTTQDIREARDHAIHFNLRIIGHTYEWSDSEVVEDHTDQPVAGFEAASVEELVP